MDGKIIQLTGAQRVRMRPAVLFGSTDLEGVKTAYEMLLQVMSAECRHGYGFCLTVTLHPDGSVTMQDDGRGLYLGNDGDPDAWERHFCQLNCDSLYAAEKKEKTEFSYFEESGKQPAGEYECEPYADYTLCALQYVCQTMEVTVQRQGIGSQIRFARGENIDGICRKESREPSGTKIHLKLDEEIFPEVRLPEAVWEELAVQTAILCRKKVVVDNRQEDAAVRREFYYPDGIFSYFNRHMPIYHKEIAALGRDRYDRRQYGARIRVALCFEKNGGFVMALHNGRRLTYGGLHVDTILQQIAKQLEWKLDLQRKAADIKKHLCLVVQTTTTSYATDWINGTRTAIGNRMITDMAYDCVQDDLGYFLKQNEKILRQFL